MQLSREKKRKISTARVNAVIVCRASQHFDRTWEMSRLTGVSKMGLSMAMECGTVIAQKFNLRCVGRVCVRDESKSEWWRDEGST